MDTLAAIGRWLSKQHVVTWCVSREDELWCANAFTSMTRIPWPFICSARAHPPWPDDRTEGEGGRHG